MELLELPKVIPMTVRSPGAGAAFFSLIAAGFWRQLSRESRSERLGAVVSRGVFRKLNCGLLAAGENVKVVVGAQKNSMSKNRPVEAAWVEHGDGPHPCHSPHLVRYPERLTAAARLTQNCSRIWQLSTALDALRETPTTTRPSVLFCRSNCIPRR